MINPSWRPKLLRPSSGPPKFLDVVWEPEPDQEFKLTPAQRRDVRAGRKVIVR